MSDNRIFISYRREDMPGVAGRLSDALERWFGEGRVFRDVDGIAAGANFETVLDQTARSAGAMIVIIGSRWLQVVDAQGQRRLDDPQDWVAREIAWGLQRGITMVPVLVDGAMMPRPSELPEALRGLCKLNALHLTDQRWVSDVERLASVLSLDLPASREQQWLTAAQWLVSVCMLLALVATTTVVVADVLNQQRPLARWVSGISFIVITGASAVLLFVERWAVAAQRRWLQASAAVGLLGTLGFFIVSAVLGIDSWQTPIVMFGGSTLTGLAMMVLMNVRGWRAP